MASLHTIAITGVAHGGHGVGRIDGQVCFVPEALPDERVSVRIERTARGVLWATLVDVVEASPHRTHPAVPRHGGNLWMHFAYPAQAEWKRRIVAECLERIAGIEADIGWVDAGVLRLGYRTRAEFHGDGRKLGFFARGSHNIVDLAACPLLHDKLNGALMALVGRGLKGSIEITVNPEGDEVLCWIKKRQPPIEKLFPQVNRRGDNRPRHQFFFDGVPVVNGGFSQSSLLLNRELVARVHELAGEPATVLDLYCGSGNLSLGLAARAEVTGIDHNEAAVHAAAGLGRGAYRTGDEAAFSAALTEREWDLVILDPPRDGAKPLHEALGRCRAQRVVYVSCDPAALARDLAALAPAGWSPDAFTAVDMFPHTPHVETVCLLTKR